MEIAPGIVGYIVSDRSLPLVNFAVFFEQSRVPMVLKDEAASSMVGSMLRRGGGGGISAPSMIPWNLSVRESVRRSGPLPRLLT